MLEIVTNDNGQTAATPSGTGWTQKKQKRFQCQHCQRLFTRLEHLQRHERTRKVKNYRSQGTCY